MLRRTSTFSALLATAAVFAWTYADTFRSLVGDWGFNDDYSHGYLVIPAALFFAYEEREKLKAARRGSSWTGLIVVAISLAMLAIGTFASQFLARLSIVGTVAGMTLFLFGAEVLRVLRFPILFLLLMIPPPGVLFNQVTFSLQLLASSLGGAMLTAANVPVVREGNVLVLPQISLDVAEACSGLRSLISLGTVTLVYAHYSLSSVWGRLLLVATTVPLALGANGLRVAATGLVAYHYGPQAAIGFFHTFSGLIVFAVTFLAVVLIRHIAVWAGRARTLARFRAAQAH